MPGKVIHGHAKYESECANCHVRFDRAAQPGLCMDCHKDVGADVRAARGYHGRLSPTECKSCHTEHKGRDARVVILDEKRFDHDKTDYRLRGKHARVACSSCHRIRTKHRDAPSACTGCHRRDDAHKGRLGSKCEQCHREQGWKDLSFDHARTQFPLTGRHTKPACVDCHPGKRYDNTPRACSSCHRKDDAHKGRFGPSCADCHSDAGWKPAKFAHDTETHFPLRGKHQQVKCESCHRVSLKSQKLPTDCYGCHRADDPHKGSMGTRCQRCHNERSWKSEHFDHDQDTAFALRGRHRSAICQSCHKGPGVPGKLPSACLECHRRDDTHRGALGTDCGKCHAENRWTQTRFDHDRDTLFALRDRHRKVPCKDCHRTPAYRDKPPAGCFACHKNDDKHQGQLGSTCQSCHSERGWTSAVFDHNRSRFPLQGTHAKVRCKSCHTTPAFKEASTECVSCHMQKDAHKERLGLRCGTCHGTDKWKPARFDHDKTTRFKLEGGHATVPCIRCHTTPVQGKIVLGSACLSCHRNDDVHFGSYGSRCEDCHSPTNWRQVDKDKVEQQLRLRKAR